MIMQMFLVQVGRDNDLESVTPHLPRQLHAKRMALFRRDLPRLEALVAVPGNVAVLLTVTLFCQDHLLEGNVLLAVDGGDELAVSSFSRVLGISKHVEEILQIRLYRFLWILHIVHQVFEPSLDMP